MSGSRGSGAGPPRVSKRADARPARSGDPEDWPAVLEQLLDGDRFAFAKFNRLLSGFLAQLRAYDFREEWEDLRQEVLVATVANARAGRLRDPGAFVGYVRIITRNKFIDRLKRQLRHREKEALPWDDETARAAPLQPSPAERPLGDAWAAVRALPGEQQRILEGLYLEGKTYQEVSDEIGMPLGTLKRRLRQSFAELRSRLSDGGDE
jgi:RNA polymerase sigma-70 factor (ECF subfamily)